VRAIVRGPSRDTAIDKRPVGGPVPVHELGLAGDTQTDTRHHGGRDKALYAYAREDAEFWAADLGMPMPPGRFGENLTASGLDVTNALVGERWQVGDPGQGVLVEVRSARTPCPNLSAHIGIPGFHKQFHRQARFGAYLRVLRTGAIAAGDRIHVVHRPADGITIGDYFTAPRRR
jgi:MOSC domain-containing protein YiiM